MVYLFADIRTKNCFSDAYITPASTNAAIASVNTVTMHAPDAGALLIARWISSGDGEPVGDGDPVAAAAVVGVGVVVVGADVAVAAAVGDGDGAVGVGVDVAAAVAAGALGGVHDPRGHMDAPSTKSLVCELRYSKSVSVVSAPQWVVRSESCDVQRLSSRKKVPDARHGHRNLMHVNALTVSLHASLDDANSPPDPVSLLYKSLAEVS